HGMQPVDVKAAKRLIQESQVLLLQLELPYDVVLEAATVAHEAGTLVVLNPAPAVAGLEEFAGLVDFVVPNESEASRLTGVSCEGEGAARAAKALLAETGASGVALTLGPRGVLVAYDGTVDLVDGHRVSCIDSVGAGDAFCGGLAARLARGAGLTEAAAYGNAAGALAVSHPHPVRTANATRPGFVEPCRDILGLREVGVFTEKLNVKRARVGGQYALHQDYPYWRGAAEDAERLVTVWVALDDATADNGPLEVLPGSHRMGHVAGKTSSMEFERNEIDPDPFDTSGMVAVEVPAGGAVFFGPYLVHRSSPNLSDVD